MGSMELVPTWNIPHPQAQGLPTDGIMRLKAAMLMRRCAGARAGRNEESFNVGSVKRLNVCDPVAGDRFAGGDPRSTSVKTSGSGRWGAPGILSSLSGFRLRRWQRHVVASRG